MRRISTKAKAMAYEVGESFGDFLKLALRIDNVLTARKRHEVRNAASLPGPAWLRQHSFIPNIEAVSNNSSDHRLRIHVDGHDVLDAEEEGMNKLPFSRGRGQLERLPGNRFAATGSFCEQKRAVSSIIVACFTHTRPLRALRSSSLRRSPHIALQERTVSAL